MDPRDRKGKGVAPIQAPRAAPSHRGGRGEASSSRMPPQQQQRPIPPVLGQMPQIPPAGLWNQALRDALQMRTMDAHTPQALYTPGVVGVPASLPLAAPPPRIPPPHQHTAAPATYRQALLTRPPPPMAPSPHQHTAAPAPYHQALPPTAPSPHTANSSTSQQLNAMDPRNHPAPPGLHPQHQLRHDGARGPVFVDAAAAAAEEVRGANLAAAAATLREEGAADSPRSRLEEVRSQLRNNTMVLEDLMLTPESSALVVQLLQEGGQEMRQRVLDEFVRYAARSIMGNQQRHAVFAALLHSFRGQHAELQQIVRAVPNLIWMSDDGMASLKLLITAVRRQAGLPEQLVDRFLGERVMEHGRGNELIAHCFTNMDYEATKLLIRHALYIIRYMLESPAGLLRLGTCFRYARPEERRHFQGIVLKYAVGMAMGRFSNYFVQLVLDHGDSQFRRDLVYKLMMHFASLSLHPHGNYVVQHCVLNKETGSPQVDLLPIVLEACNRQSRRELQGLVQTHPATFVLHTLLETGKAVTHCRALTQNLERIINDLLSRARRYRR